MQDETTLPTGDELLNDREGQRLLKVGPTKWFELEKQPDFPKPLLLGPRLKRRPRSELMAWALSQQREPAANWVETRQRASEASKAKRREARRTSEVAA